MSAIQKLVGFSIALFTVPISAYFVTLESFGSFYAALLAALLVNLIAFGFVYAAFAEDTAQQPQAKNPEKPKTQKSKNE